MATRISRIKRIDKAAIEELITTTNQAGEISEADQAEMAIPSYLNKNPLIRAIFWRRYDRMFRMFRLKPEMVACEFGCGIGAFLPTLTEHSAKVYAVDLFPQYAKALAEKLNLQIEFSTSLDTIPDESLDVLYAAEVLEHLDDLPAGIRLIGRKLKPDGRLIMSGPTESALYKFGRFLVGYNKYHDYHRNNVYDIKQEILNNGFSLERTIHYPNRLVLLNLICSFQVKK